MLSAKEAAIITREYEKDSQYISDRLYQRILRRAERAVRRNANQGLAFAELGLRKSEVRFMDVIVRKLESEGYKFARNELGSIEKSYYVEDSRTYIAFSWLKQKTELEEAGG